MQTCRSYRQYMLLKQSHKNCYFMQFRTPWFLSETPQIIGICRNIVGCNVFANYKQKAYCVLKRYLPVLK